MNAVNNSILQTARYNFQQASAGIGLDADIFERIALPKEKIELRISPVLSSGKVANVEVFIARHSDILGPAKGGIRMTPTVSMVDVAGLAMEMTWKTSLIGVPFGGGKSGICFDPSLVSENNKEIIIRSFARAAKRHFGPELYIPAPDMGTNEVDMGHIRDCISYSEGVSITKGCFVTGKPIILGGIPGRRTATGKGVVYTIIAACKKLGINPEDMRVVIQGFGNVGSEAAKELSVNGVKIIAISDISGGLLNGKGIDIEDLVQYTLRNGSIKGYLKADSISNEDIFKIPCECLIPAASGSQITKDNAGEIKTLIIAEGANAPTTPDADEILNDGGIFVIPDILCNAGGVFVSYLEYTQETQREQMTLEQVESRLSERMNKKFDEVFNYSKDKNVSMREAAMDIAVRRVAEAVNARG
ncbi:MAG: Glu/Leu/Phe/Val dehydrogenase, partial [Thermoplasmata archaeon]|nr:Glu/Leu/Phe/Val dehydrogenase [Thermoplasmata archaeon]